MPIRLMVNLLFIEDDQALTKPGVVRSLYDPTAGTGGMLSVADEQLTSLNPKARLVMYGQELNPESYAICKADMLIKGQGIANITIGFIYLVEHHHRLKLRSVLLHDAIKTKYKSCLHFFDKPNGTASHSPAGGCAKNDFGFYC